MSPTRGSITQDQKPSLVQSSAGKHRLYSQALINSPAIALDRTPAQSHPQPDHLTPAHRQEWLDSRIDPNIISANVISLDGTNIYNYLLQSPHLPRTNTGRIQNSFLQRYAPLEAGGWWCSGLDPFTHWKDSEWGQFKADRPRRYQKQPGIEKIVKYDPPPKTSTRAYFLRVPDYIAWRIFDRHGYTPTRHDWAQGFWHCVWVGNLPIVITEGAKKAGALLTAGYAAIALPGISSGYRNPKDGHGTPTGCRALIPDLDYMATVGRTIYICFDYDAKATTRESVRQNISMMGQLLKDKHCPVHVVDLPGPEKGVDDFIAARSAEAFDPLIQHALPLDQWRSHFLFQLTYPAALDINEADISPVRLPTRGLVGIRSPKGTGKTALLEPLIHEAMREGRRTLLISHRIQLGRATCDRLGLNYISDQTDWSALLGVGLCIDSLHPNSQAQFNVNHWSGAILLLDECEQVLWHLLNSATCQKQRISILETFKALIRHVLSTDGLIIALDADLSDISVDFLLNYASTDVTPWILINRWQPPTGWDITLYETHSPAPLYLAIETAIAEGSVFICSDAQKAKSPWGTINLEARLQTQYPEKKILRIDSQTVSDPTHQAYNSIQTLNQTLSHYDVVIASPSISSGVSITLQNHFVAVFGITQGTLPDNEVRQMLARVRDHVPRHLWARRIGVGKIGNGATNYHSVAQSMTTRIGANLRLLQSVEFNIDGAYDPITFRTWAKFAARVNASLYQLRASLYAGLLQEGHRVKIYGTDYYDSDLLKTVARQQQAVCDRSRTEELQAIANAPALDLDAYQVLKKQRSKTAQDRVALERYRIEQRYGVPITPDLIRRDHAGWYTQLRLHYFLLRSPDVVQGRDRLHWQAHLIQGNGAYCPQDIRTYSDRVRALQILQVDTLLDPNRDISGIDPDIIAIANQAKQWRHDLKTLFNITIPAEGSPIQIIQILLGLINIKLHRHRRARLPDQSRCWVYRYRPPEDNRTDIFAVWDNMTSDASQEEPEQSAESGSPLLQVSQGHPPLDIDLNYLEGDPQTHSWDSAPITETRSQTPREPLPRLKLSQPTNPLSSFCQSSSPHSETLTTRDSYG